MRLLRGTWRHLSSDSSNIRCPPRLGKKKRSGTQTGKACKEGSAEKRNQGLIPGCKLSHRHGRSDRDRGPTETGFNLSLSLSVCVASECTGVSRWCVCVCVGVCLCVCVCVCVAVRPLTATTDTPARHRLPPPLCRDYIRDYTAADAAPRHLTPRLLANERSFDGLAVAVGAGTIRPAL